MTEEFPTVTGITVSVDGTKAILTISCGCEDRVDIEDEDSLSLLGAELREHVCTKGDQ